MAPFAQAKKNPENQERAVTILAKSLFRDLRARGFESREVLAFASNLVELVTEEIREQNLPDKKPTKATAATISPAR